MEPTADSTRSLERLAITRELAAWAATADSTTIPNEAMRDARLFLQDTLGCMVAGAAERSAVLSRRACTPLRPGYAEIAGTSQTSAAADAAWLNGIAAHALDFDDVIVGSFPLHGSAVVVPAVLAIAQERDLGGTRLIEAIAVGAEAGARLATTMSERHYARGFHATGTVGVLAASVGVGRALGLDSPSIATALGLAATTASGLKGSFGSMAKHLNVGNAAANAVRAGLLAEQGFTAMPDALDHPQGFIAAFDGEEPNRRDATSARWLMSGTMFKAHASCAATHATIDAVATVRAHVTTGSVERILISVPSTHLDVCAIANPRNSTEAKFSLAFTSALTLAGHDALPADFSPERLSDPAIRALMQVVEIDVDPSLPPLGAHVTIVERTGQSWSASADSLSAPAGRDGLQTRLDRKFTALAEPHLGASQADALLDAIHDLPAAATSRRLFHPHSTGLDREPFGRHARSMDRHTVSVNETTTVSEKSVAVLPRGLATINPFTVTRAVGAEIWDTQGRRYLDFAGNVGCANIGHNHPRVVKAIQDQTDRLLLSAAQLALHDRYVPTCNRIAYHSPISGQNRVFLTNSGAEAVENAIRIARGYSGRMNVISFTNAFHGRTALSATLSGDPESPSYLQLAHHVFRTRYPDPYRGAHDADQEITQVMSALRQLADQVQDVAAVILEPIQGEGGYVMPPATFFEMLSTFCRERQIVMIADEIQSGFGRTGTFFACEGLGFEPDLLTFGKSVANGLPLAGVLGRASVMDALAPGGLGGTYGGNPLACAAAEAVLDVIEGEQLTQRARSIGEWIASRSADYTTRFPLVGDVRITGAMAAFELVVDKTTKEPASAACSSFVAACRDHGLLVVPAGPARNIIRFLGAINLTDEQLDEGFTIIESVLTSLR